MTRLVALFLFAAAACGRPHPTTAPPAHVDDFQLQPINQSGDMSKSLYVGGEPIVIGLAARGRVVKVVRVDGKRQIDVFVPPAAIPGVPATAFDYAIDPGPKAEGDDEQPDRFTFVTSGSVGHMIYTTTWVLTWNSARGAFDVSAPTTVSRDAAKCDVCDEAT